MSESDPLLRASYDFCRWLCRSSGSNFYMAFRLLPRKKRCAMDALYAFMRQTDDLADGPLQPNMRQEALVVWRKKLQSSLSSQGNAELTKKAFCVWNIHQRAFQSLSLAERLKDTSSPFLNSPELTFMLFGDLLLPALADTVARFNIPPEHLFAVIDGVEMDLAPKQYETFEELEAYCQRVASAVGLACIHIWGFHGKEAIEHAGATGIALQLTNILRDVQEDAHAGRLYLPLADLRQCGCSLDPQQWNADDPNVLRLMIMEIERAEQFYRDGARLMDFLEPDGRRIFGLILSTYHELLKTIERHPQQTLRQRVRLGTLKRLQLAARWTLFPSLRIVF
jgi:15-cis-phytoene synthase